MSVDPTALNLDVEPPAKRRRTNDLTPDERKEARAHRNRIAAQNSRDRRKAHYATLEQRLADLQAENERLKAQSPSSETARENAELRERVKTLENGWQTVLTALANQGLTLPSLPVVNTTTTIAPLSPALTSQDSSPQTSPSPLDLTPTDFDPEPLNIDDNATRHLAAGSTLASSLPSALLGPDNRSDLALQSSGQALADLLCQILTDASPQTPTLSPNPHPTTTTTETVMTSAGHAADLGMHWTESSSPKTDTKPGALDFDIPLDLSLTFDWTSFDSASAPSTTASPESNEEMQRLLDQYTWNDIQV